MAESHFVWSPADNDRMLMGWPPDFIPSDDLIAEAILNGDLSLRRCLKDDLAAIFQAVYPIGGAAALGKSLVGVNIELTLARGARAKRTLFRNGVRLCCQLNPS